VRLCGDRAKTASQTAWPNSGPNGAVNALGDAPLAPILPQTNTPAGFDTELARIMGTSVPMIERHYGALLDGSGAGITARLDAFAAERDRDTDADASDA
jgi:hypothetical protein